MAVLLDTSFLIAYHNNRDAHHERAREMEIEDTAINDYVYNEIINIIQSRNSHSKAVDYGKFLRKSVNILRVSKPVFDRTVDIFQQNQISFTDSSLVATAEITGIERIASFDRDFESFNQINRIH